MMQGDIVMSLSSWVFIIAAFVCIVSIRLLGWGVMKRVLSVKTSVLGVSLAAGLFSMFVTLALRAPWPVVAAMFAFGVVCGVFSGWMGLTILKRTGDIEDGSRPGISKMTEHRFVRGLLVSGPLGLVVGVWILIRGGAISLWRFSMGWSPLIQDRSLAIILYAVFAILSLAVIMVYLVLLLTTGRTQRKKYLLIPLNFSFAVAPSACGLLFIALTGEMLWGRTLAIFAIMYTVVSTVAGYAFIQHSRTGNQDTH